MPIIFRCDNCQQKLSVSSRKGGTKVNCPKCERPLMVPVPEAKLVFDDEAAPPAKSQLPATREITPAEKNQADADLVGWATTKEYREKPAQQGEAVTVPSRPAAATVSEPPRQPPVRPLPSLPAKPVEEEEEFTLRRSQTELEDMDLTPMVDVTFLLLIFFMITASFSLTKTIESPAPDPENQGAQTIQNMEELEMTSIMVRIDSEDTVFVDDEPVDVADLETTLGDKLRSEQKNELIIQASPLCRHETFVAVFDSATGAGMQRIRLAASKGED